MSKRFQTQMVGMKVVGANGRMLGDVDDLVIDEETWRVTGLFIRVNSDAIGELGLEKPFWSRARFEVPVSHVAGATDIVVLRTTLAEFANLIASAEVE